MENKSVFQLEKWLLISLELHLMQLSNCSSENHKWTAYFAKQVPEITQPPQVDTPFGKLLQIDLAQTNKIFCSC